MQTFILFTRCNINKFSTSEYFIWITQIALGLHVPTRKKNNNLEKLLANLRVVTEKRQSL